MTLLAPTYAMAQALNRARHSGVRANPIQRTPDALFARLDAEFDFTLDAAASARNAKCPRYFTKRDDALRQRWTGRVWLNPPYGAGIGDWMRKARLSAEQGATVVCLVPSLTDMAWWHDEVLPHAAEIRYIRGRVRFVHEDGYPAISGAFRPHAVIVYRPRGR